MKFSYPIQSRYMVFKTLERGEDMDTTWFGIKAVTNPKKSWIQICRCDSNKIISMCELTLYVCVCNYVCMYV